MVPGSSSEVADDRLSESLSAMVSNRLFSCRSRVFNIYDCRSSLANVSEMRFFFKEARTFSMGDLLCCVACGFGDCLGLGTRTKKMLRLRSMTFSSFSWFISWNNRMAFRWNKANEKEHTNKRSQQFQSAALENVALWSLWYSNTHEFCGWIIRGYTWTRPPLRALEQNNKFCKSYTYTIYCSKK